MKVVILHLAILSFSLIVLGSPNKVSANTLNVEYKTFYSHLNKLSSDETDALQFAFGFMNIHTKKLCGINSAKISTEKQQIPLEVTAEQRFTLPTDKILRLAKALVVLDLNEASNICDISVQLETKPEYLKTNYSGQELAFIYQQYVAFFDDIGSFMSFIMPDVDGITIQFKDKTLTETLSNDIVIQNGVLTIQGSKLATLNELTLPQLPLRITAITSK
jgi:hypothetical protein